ncbi:MAG TPA: hypothetical protein VN039_07670 [Nitrospira sp.]|nr:hypothetical protein [Nitrospira sp.]
MRWKFIGLITAAILAMALALYGATLWKLHVRRASNPPPHLTPLLTGYAASTNLPVDPILHCVMSQKDLRMADKPLSKGFVDHLMQGNADWTAISERMQAGDVIYAYSHEAQVPPGMSRPDAFTGISSGYVVLRGRCLIGMIGTMVE